MAYLEYWNRQVIGEHDPCDGFSARGRGEGSLVRVEPLRVEAGEDRREGEGVGQLHAGVVVLDGWQVLHDRCQELRVEFYHLEV